MFEDEMPPDAQRLFRVFRMASDVLSEIGTPLGLVAIPASIWLFVQYLSAVKAPFPVASATLPILFSVLVVMIANIGFTIALSMGWIVWQAYPFRFDCLRREAPHLKSHVKPLYGLNFKIGAAEVGAERKRRSRRRRFAAVAQLEYLMVYAPFLMCWLLTFIGGVFDWQPSAKAFLFSLLACVLVGGALSAGLFHRLRSKVRISEHVESVLIRTRNFVLTVTAESSIMIILLIPYLAITEVIGSSETKSFGLEVLFIILVTHLVANIARFRPVQTILFCIFFLFFPILFSTGTPLYAGLALRVLGIGGGIPREVILQTINSSSGKSETRVIDGCILLTTGDSISLHPADRREECSLPKMLHDSFTAPEKWRVETFPASAVVQVTTSFKEASVPAANHHEKN